MPPRSFPPKYDVWLMIVTLSSVLIPVVIGIVAIAIGDSWQGMLVMVVGAGVIVVVMLGIAWPVRYVLDDGDLRVSAGRWLRWRIDVQSIVRVGPVRTAYSSPAWSMDKLEIEYRRGNVPDFILIAPRDSGAFLDELSKRNPALVREGDSLRTV